MYGRSVILALALTCLAAGSAVAQGGQSQSQGSSAQSASGGDTACKTACDVVNAADQGTHSAIRPFVQPTIDQARSTVNAVCSDNCPKPSSSSSSDNANSSSSSSSGSSSNGNRSSTPSRPPRE